MNRYLMLGALGVVAITQAGCGTQVRTLPIQQINAAPAMKTDVAVYFGTQGHPAVQQRLGEATFSVRIARSTQTADVSCQAAFADALGKLRDDARAHNANAVINVTTRFHDTTSSAPSEFTCGVSPSAAAIAVRGERVVLQPE